MDNLLPKDIIWSVIQSKIIVLTIAEYEALELTGDIKTDVLYIRLPNP